MRERERERESKRNEGEKGKRDGQTDRKRGRERGIESLSYNFLDMKERRHKEIKGLPTYTIPSKS